MATTERKKNKELAEQLYQKALICVDDDRLSQAIPYYQQAVKLGHIDASLDLAEMLIYGIGCDRDEQKGFQLYLQLTEMGIAEGMYRISLCYEYGIGTGFDGDKAIMWKQNAYQTDPTEFFYLPEAIDETLEMILTPPIMRIFTYPQSVHEFMYDAEQHNKDFRRYASLKKILVSKRVNTVIQRGHTMVEERASTMKETLLRDAIEEQTGSLEALMNLSETTATREDAIVIEDDDKGFENKAESIAAFEVFGKSHERKDEMKVERNKRYTLTLTKQKSSIYTEIKLERRRQDKQWDGPDSDDNNNKLDWLRYINKQLNYAHSASEAEYRARLVKIAALAIAAIESADHKLSRQFIKQ